MLKQRMNAPRGEGIVMATTSQRKSEGLKDRDQIEAGREQREQTNRMALGVRFTAVPSTQGSRMASLGMY